MAGPDPGQMILYDDILPPLPDNSYRMTLQTNVTIGNQPQPLDQKQSFFDINGPRFRLQAADVAGVFPPRNGNGPFDGVIPQIAMYRRTLPWERELDPDNQIGTPTTNSDLPALSKDGLPWVALLVFEEGEYTLLENKPLEQVLPKTVLDRMGNPTGITCDAIEVNNSLLDAVLPSKEELQLLAHVRQVNVEDRELAVGSKDGFFSVVMSNRLPSPNAKCRACLVSLELWPELVAKEPPPSLIGMRVVEAIGHVLPPAAGIRGAATQNPAVIVNTQLFLNTRLVVLYSWQFTVVGDNNFRGLMQTIDVGLMGKVAEPGHPALTDTAHIKLDLQDRAGAPEQVLYRGPLVPFQLTRDPLGPYHSADQCRRATVETGAEDVSYAAAFETGRLLAAADPRLAQELMRWRREAYKQSSRIDSVSKVHADLAIATPLDMNVPIAPVVAASAIEKVVQGIGPIADAYGLNKTVNVIGLNPAAVQTAFQLGSQAEAVALLGGDAAALGATVAAPAQTARPNTNIDAVAADTASLDRLNQARNRLLNNTAVKLGVQNP
jgi:hypothetical protein